MNTNDKANDKSRTKSKFGADLQDTMMKESADSMVEYASDFGVIDSDVRKLKKRLERN